MKATNALTQLALSLKEAATEKPLCVFDLIRTATLIWSKNADDAFEKRATISDIRTMLETELKHAGVTAVSTDGVYTTLVNSDTEVNCYFSNEAESLMLISPDTDEPVSELDFSPLMVGMKKRKPLPTSSVRVVESEPEVENTDSTVDPSDEIEEVEIDSRSQEEIDLDAELELEIALDQEAISPTEKVAESPTFRDATNMLSAFCNHVSTQALASKSPFFRKNFPGMTYEEAITSYWKTLDAGIEKHIRKSFKTKNKNAYTMLRSKLLTHNIKLEQLLA